MDKDHRVDASNGVTHGDGYSKSDVVGSTRCFPKTCHDVSRGAPGGANDMLGNDAVVWGRGTPAVALDVPAELAMDCLSISCTKTNELQPRPDDRYPNRWRKGQSGNPKGRPLGSRHRATVLAESLLDGQTEELIQKTIELALGGDTTALRLCIEQIIAPRRDRPVDFKLPALNGAEDAMVAMGTIADGVATGDLAPAEAAELAKVVEVYRSVVETADIERRLCALEEARRGEREEEHQELIGQTGSSHAWAQHKPGSVAN